MIPQTVLSMVPKTRKLEFFFYSVIFRQSFIDLQGDLNAGGMLSDGVKWLLVLIP